MDAPPDVDGEAFWRDYLTRGASFERRVRRVFRVLPREPRCQLCASPFAGPVAPLMKLVGKRPADMNPHVCQACFSFLAKHHGGAEIEVSFLFADIRGSTALAERMSAGAFRSLLERFYVTASAVVFANDGAIDKFVGDEVMAMFFPLTSGVEHAHHAVEAATALLRATGHADADGPWVPLGAGVHTGIAWVGAVGDDTHTEITALGDAVNTAARLASTAAAGEILVTTAAARAAGLLPAPERRTLTLKGKESTTEVEVLRVTG